MTGNQSLIEAFDYAGSILSIGYFLTPLYQIIYLYKGRLHVQQIPLVLILTILLNCLLWNLFGYYRLNKWISMLVTNSIGIVFNVVILFLYLYLLCNKEIWKFLGYGLFVINLLVEITYLMYRYIIEGKSDQESEIDVFGFSGMIVNVLMYASPCINIIDLFKTRQRQFMPILTNIIGFFAALTWLCYGVIKHDGDKNNELRTIISNGVSLFVLIIQIGIWLYFFYTTSKKNTQPLIISDVGKIENNEETIK